eukprot:NODE_655_length_1727_cov_65.272500_g645_i0.p2 GENE.NODE_655_length_1727_cov_65.272500_g645_i0~~NODE_655_length_1727_cov_65.272500_g645_i0.p2  ORF type:complete len:528 (+),score=163.43 NODE_655_length_1727_cov_65.272500_g645_i0:60-1586(+)
MGGGLSRPITNKHMTRLVASDVVVGSAEMQGFRMDMEDDLIVDRTMDEARFMPANRSANRGDGNSSAIFMGVFDGHVGAEASRYLAAHLPDAVKAMGDLKNQTWIDTFMELDAKFCATKQAAGSTCVTALMHKDPIDIDQPDCVPASLREKGDCTSMPGASDEAESTDADEDSAKDGESGSAAEDANGKSAADGKEQDEDEDASAAGAAAGDGDGASGSGAGASNKKMDVEASNAEREKRKWHLTVCNVGDSRCLVGRADGTWEAMTKDHKPDDEQELRRIENAGGHVSWSRVDGQLALSRAFGDLSYKETKSMPADKQKVIAYPDVTRTVIYPGDWVLLCCDGIFEGMSNAQVMHHLWVSVQAVIKSKGSFDPAKIMASLCEEALSNNSRDNMSAMLVYVRDDELVTADMVSNLGPSSEYVATSVPHTELGQAFVKAYADDAAKFGVTGVSEKLQPMVREAVSASQHEEINNFIANTVSGPCPSHHIRDYPSGTQQESKKRKLNSGK